MPRHKGRAVIRHYYANQLTCLLWPLRVSSNLTYLPWDSVSNVKALVGTLNQEKALIGAFSVIAKSWRIFVNLRLKLYPSHHRQLAPASPWRGVRLYQSIWCLAGSRISGQYPAGLLKLRSICTRSSNCWLEAAAAASSNQADDECSPRPSSSPPPLPRPPRNNN